MWIKKHWIIVVSLIIILFAGILVGVDILLFLRDYKNETYQQIIGQVNKVYSLRSDKNFSEQLMEQQIMGQQEQGGILQNVSNLDSDKTKVNNQTVKYKLPSGFQQRQFVVSFKDKYIFKGSVHWIKPIDLGDLGLTSEKVYNGCVYNSANYRKSVNPRYLCPEDFHGASRGIKYVKVGKIIDSEFKDHDIIMVRTGYMEGPGSDDWVMMFKKDHKIIFLLNDSTKYLNEILYQYFQQGDYDIKIIEGLKFEELMMPEVLVDNKTGSKFIKNKYDIAFFDSSSLVPTFKNLTYGQVWMTNPINPKNSNLELNSYWSYDHGKKQPIKEYNDIFHSNGFYIRLPNGMTASYKLVLDDVADSQDRFSVLKAVWKDGIINNSEYEFNPSGCGSSSYVYNETGDVTIKDDLKLVGKTINGKNLYGFRDTSTKNFQRLYNDIYHSMDGQKKNPEDFLKIHPKVFYVDPYGRLLAFYRADILSPAECGKPVIYLYPKSTTKVNVKIKPNQGVSISEPEYPKNGWTVLAKSNGKLIFQGKKYPYLFWEGSSDVNYKQSKYGWVVEKKDLDNFLNNKLIQLGLIQKEIDDFKEFWIPEMIKHNKPYYFITFLPQRKIDQLAPLDITPKPDTIIRVMMDYHELGKFKNVIGFNIKKPKRKGFTVVEWGGMLK